MNTCSYITPEQIKDNELSTGESRDDEQIARLCLEASRDLELLADGLWFYPVREVVYFDQQGDYNQLILNKPLLEIVAATTGNGSLTLTPANLFLKRGEQYGTPANKIVVSNLSDDYFYSATSGQRCTAITGEWGYIEGYESGNSWLETNVTLTAISGNDFTVTGLGGRDGLGLYGSVDRLSLIRWRNDSNDRYEYDFVTQLDETSDIITVRRGVNGSSSLSLTATAEIQVFRPLDSISHAARRLVGWYYRQRDSSRPDIDRPITTNSGTILPSSFPRDVIQVMKSFSQVVT